MKRTIFKGVLLGLISFLIIVIITVELTIIINNSPHIIEINKSYTNDDFGIVTYTSNMDKDKDGIDDQTDFLQNVREYIAKKPKYKSEYYAGGYPTGEYGVCTDVIAIAALNTGYDLRTLVNEDIKSRKNEYEIETIDIDIDFRRTKNLKIYLDNNALVLTNDLSKIEEWQGGDIVVFKGHIGVVSDKRNENGIPYLIHHANAFQTIYEEPGGLERLNDIIIGHYRLS